MGCRERLGSPVDPKRWSLETKDPIWGGWSATGSSPFHPPRGPLAAILPLFPRRVQFPIPLGLNLLLMPGEHVRGRDVADGAVQTHVVVMLWVTPHQTKRIFERERSSGTKGFPFEGFVPTSDFAVRLRVMGR